MGFALAQKLGDLASPSSMGPRFDRTLTAAEQRMLDTLKRECLCQFRKNVKMQGFEHDF
jgi:hypothetical protein